MPYYFFFSYARANYDAYLQTFFDDLSRKICDIEGFKPDTEVGFFDQQDLELGAEWNPALAQALQECPVLVSMYSPAYFNSIYSGREWEFFYRRRALHPSAPSVIKPVIWIPLRRDRQPPPRVGALQYFIGDPAAAHNAQGLQKMRKQHANYQTEYDDFVEALANEIIDARQNVQLPPLDPLPPLGDLPSAFHPQGAAAQHEGHTPQGGGPRSVRFVMVAASPGEFGQPPQGTARAQDFYLQNGGIEWKPYHPDFALPLITLAQVEAGYLGFDGSPLPCDDKLPERIRELERSGSLVILFVDGWTADLPQYKQILQNFDQNIYKNCSVFVPWNDKDPQTANRSPYLKALVRNDVFSRWSLFGEMPDPFRFRDKIGSVVELRDQLRDTLLKLQPLATRNAIEHARDEDIARRIETDISKPNLAHQPAPAEAAGGGA